MSEIEARRDRAMTAYWASGGKYNDPDGHPDGAEAAVRVATRVQITPEIVVAFESKEQGRCCDCGSNTPEGLRAAFRAAGFEVEQ